MFTVFFSFLSIFSFSTDQFQTIKSNEIRQKLIDIQPFESRIRFESDFSMAHNIEIEFPPQARPYLNSLSKNLDFKYDKTKNTLVIFTSGPCSFEITIFKYLQPVFYSLANMDKGLPLIGPKARIIDKNIIFQGNDLMDRFILSDVSFPFVAFVVISITTFFITQYHITRFFK